MPNSVEMKRACAMAFPFATLLYAAALVQLGSIGLYPAPDATGFHLQAAFRQKFGDVLIGERIS
jgi:hypothetical protein